MGLSAAEPAEDRFADLVCADDQWLREEFDALIEAGFGGPPPPSGPPARLAA
jgi:hypothetical protein